MAAIKDKHSTMLYIGVHVDAVREARAAIMDILKGPGSEATQIAAFRCLRHLCKVGNTTISNCNFTGSPR